MTIDKKKTGGALQDDAMHGTPNTRTSLSNAALKQAILDHLLYSIGRVPAVAPDRAYYKALSLAVRDRLEHQKIFVSFVVDLPNVGLTRYLT